MKSGEEGNEALQIGRCRRGEEDTRAGGAVIDRQGCEDARCQMRRALKRRDNDCVMQDVLCSLSIVASPKRDGGTVEIDCL